MNETEKPVVIATMEEKIKRNNDRYERNRTMWEKRRERWNRWKNERNTPKP